MSHREPPVPSDDSADDTRPRAEPDEEPSSSAPGRAPRDDEDGPRAAVGGDVFSDADLEPTPEQKRSQLRSRLDWLATGVALCAAGVWAGQIVAMRWGVEPAIAERLPGALSGLVRAATLQRVDQLALGFAAVVLGTEVVRTVVAPRDARAPMARVRRIAAVIAGALAALSALVVTPRIVTLIAAGALAAPDAPAGELASLWQRGEQLRLAELVLLALVLVLCLRTLPRRSDAEDDAGAPLPPGPWQRGR